ncbi:MAG: hypothetical protein HWN80_06150 [Candidatus Lokiarchaeota archaeon]|nr:hypothetical protein [Candidatus Lokiarchaeota archaeon]
MNWKKLGKIFDPLDYELSSKYFGFAQSPQAIVFDDFIRIYFSIRKLDFKNKFISHIEFVDMSLDLKTVLNTSKREVISVGELGCFDEHGIFPFSPVRINDMIYAYTSGWSRRKSVSVDNSIGLAISKDNGLTFKRYGNGPVLTSSLYEPFLIVDGFVRKFNKNFYMFYIFGQQWYKENEIEEPERVYKIGYAISNDGINWKKMNRCIIENKIDENECQALPTVIKIGERYHMYFCFRHMIGFRKEREKAYRLGYAYSDDLINWIRDDDNVGITTTQGDWDSSMMCYPNLVEVNGKIYLLYNGNEFGKFGFGVAKLMGVDNER